MPSSATNSVPAVAARRFLSPNVALGFRVILHVEHSPQSPAWSVYDRQQEQSASVVGQGSRIFVTVLPLVSSWNGTAPALTSDANCRNSQLTSVTWMSPIPTGISRLFRNSSNLPRNALL